MSGCIRGLGWPSTEPELTSFDGDATLDLCAMITAMRADDMPGFARIVQFCDVLPVLVTTAKWMAVSADAQQLTHADLLRACQRAMGSQS